jgi:archaellum component FlaF (FlaF/FlaG flagellin family)
MCISVVTFLIAFGIIYNMVSSNRNIDEDEEARKKEFYERLEQEKDKCIKICQKGE